jgi:hypothetical protein
MDYCKYHRYLLLVSKCHFPCGAGTAGGVGVKRSRGLPHCIESETVAGKKSESLKNRTPTVANGLNANPE